MTIRLPPDIEALVVSRVSSGEFSSAEEVVRTAMAPWLERQRGREDALTAVRAKIAQGDADDSDFAPSDVRERLDGVAASLSRTDPSAA